LAHQSRARSSPQTRGRLQQRNRLTVKRLTLLTQLLLDLPTGPTLLPLSGGHVMAGQSPEASQQGAVICTTTGLTEDHGLSGDAGLQNPAPTPQIFEGHSNTVRHCELSGTTAAQPSTHTSKGPYQHLLHRKFLLFRNQDMTRLMHGNPTQTLLTTRQGFGQDVSTHALPGGGINTQGDQGTPNSHHNPSGRQTQGRAKGSEHGDTSNGDTGA
jgi:hypothetical protein